MARIKIDLPDEFVFCTDIPIRIGDMNRGMHLGHEVFFTIMEEARTRFINSLGYDEQDIHGLSYLMTYATIVYLQQVRYGQTLRIEIASCDISSRGFDLIYKASDSQTGTEVCRAKTGHLLFDYHNQKAATIPAEFREKILKSGDNN